MEPEISEYSSEAEAGMPPAIAHEEPARWTPDNLTPSAFDVSPFSSLQSFDAPLNALGSGCVMSFMLGRR